MCSFLCDGIMKLTLLAWWPVGWRYKEVAEPGYVLASFWLLTTVNVQEYGIAIRPEWDATTLQRQSRGYIRWQCESECFAFNTTCREWLTLVPVTLEVPRLLNLISPHLLLVLEIIKTNPNFYNFCLSWEVDMTRIDERGPFVSFRFRFRPSL